MVEYKFNYKYITRQEELNDVVEWANRQRYVAFDIETGPGDAYLDKFEEDNKLGLDPYRNKIYTFQIGNRFNQYIVDTRANLNLGGIKEILENEDIGILGVNIRFDCANVMHHWGIIPTRVMDCMIMEQVARTGIFVIGQQNEGKAMAVRRFTGMKALAKRYMGIDIDKDKDLRINLWKTELGMFNDRQLAYMAGDCIYPDVIAKEQKKLIVDRDLSRVIQLEHELIPVIAAMELEGIPFDRTYWIHLMQEAHEEMRSHEKVLDRFMNQTMMFQDDLFGEGQTIRKYDYGSSKQLAKALTEAGVKGFRASNGEYTSTSSDKIKLMKVDGRIDPDLADALVNYRVEKKKVESYGENFLQAVHPITGRIHPNFTQTCLVTGRMSCSPGMQTIPRDKLYRKAFNSPDGYTLIILDASQIEARISADLTNDEPAIKVFQEGKDIYKEDGQLMFQREIIRGTEEGESLRSRAKVSWLGLTYGQGKAKFNRYCRLFLGEDIPVEDTNFLYDKFFEIHWKMKEVMDGWSASADPLSTNDYYKDHMADALIRPESARESLMDIYTDRMDPNRAAKIVDYMLSRKDKVTYTTTLLGRKRFYRTDFVGWYTAARNHPIQGTAADIQKATMLAFQKLHWDQGFNANIINVVHDEIITIVREDQAEELLREQIRVGEEAGQAYLTKVPMKLEGGISKVWTKF